MSNVTKSRIAWGRSRWGDIRSKCGRWFIEQFNASRPSDIEYVVHDLAGSFLPDGVHGPPDSRPTIETWKEGCRQRTCYTQAEAKRSAERRREKTA